MAARKMPRPAGYHWSIARPIQRADGKKPCRWCFGPVEPPKRAWCGNPVCIHEWRRRCSWDLTRDDVFKRDKGVCGICGLDTEKVKEVFGRLDRESLIDDALEALKADGFTTAQVFKAALLGDRLRFSWGHLWEADHVRPVAEGGDWFELANLQTACLVCHKAKTKEQAARRRRRP